MSKASDLFRRAAKKCPSEYSTAARDQWIEGEIIALEKINDEISDLDKQAERAVKEYQAALDKIKATRKVVQGRCDHEFYRGTAECEPSCKICGYSEPDYRRS